MHFDIKPKFKRFICKFINIHVKKPDIKQSSFVHMLLVTSIQIICFKNVVTLYRNTDNDVGRVNAEIFK